MIVIPAIDLIEGQVVRLVRGNYVEKTVYPGEPESYVIRWQECGAKRIHVVDLEGARTGQIHEWHTLERLVGVAKVPIEFGGGVRSLADIKRLFDIGIQFVILGTAAIKNSSFFDEALRMFSGRVLVSLDARGGKLRTEGWTEDSGVDVSDFCRRLAERGVRQIIYTNIEKDGVLLGPDTEGLKRLLKETNLSVILSGGVSNLEDVRKLTKISDVRFIGVICGRALYEGTLDLKDAMDIK